MFHAVKGILNCPPYGTEPSNLSIYKVADEPSKTRSREAGSRMFGGHGVVGEDDLLLLQCIRQVLARQAKKEMVMACYIV